jgi:hypothetical protein
MIYVIDHQGAVRRHFLCVPIEGAEREMFTRAIESLVREAEASALPVLQTLELDATVDGLASIVTRHVQQPVTLVPLGAHWKYLDDGSDPGGSWRAVDFDDSDWKEGEAQLGFGDGDERTVIRGGTDAQRRCATTFFRRRFDFPQEAPGQSLDLNLVVDDGAVVYLNGQEVARVNVPLEVVQGDYTTQDSGDNAIFVQVIPSQAVRPGSNVLTVAVYQRSPDSSDLSFDLGLTHLRPRNTAVLRFDEVIGNGRNSVPLGAIISDAKLILSVENSVPAFNLQHVVGSGLSHEIAVPKIGSEAAGIHEFDVMGSLQEWSTGKPNEGWAIVAAVDHTDQDAFNNLKARLVIRYWPPPAVTERRSGNDIAVGD